MLPEEACFRWTNPVKFPRSSQSPRLRSVLSPTSIHPCCRFPALCLYFLVLFLLDSFTGLFFFLSWRVCMRLLAPAVADSGRCEKIASTDASATQRRTFASERTSRSEKKKEILRLSRGKTKHTPEVSFFLVCFYRKFFFCVSETCDDDRTCTICGVMVHVFSLLFLLFLVLPKT